MQNAEPQGPQPGCGRRQLRACRGPSWLPAPKRQSRRFAPQASGEPFQSPPLAGLKSSGRPVQGGASTAREAGGTRGLPGRRAGPGVQGTAEERRPWRRAGQPAAHRHSPLGQGNQGRDSPKEPGRLCSRLEARLSSARLPRPPISGGRASSKFPERSRRCRLDRAPRAGGSVRRRLWVTARKVRDGRAPRAAGSSERQLRDSRRASRPHIWGTQAGSVSRLLKLRSRWAKWARPLRLAGSVVRDPRRQAPRASRRCPPDGGKADRRGLQSQRPR